MPGAAEVRADELAEGLTVEQPGRGIELRPCLDAAQLFAVRTIKEHEPDREERERQELEQRCRFGLALTLSPKRAMHDQRQRRESEEEPRAHAPRSSSASQRRDAERRDRDRDRKVRARHETLQRHVDEHARGNETWVVPIVCPRGFSRCPIY